MAVRPIDGNALIEWFRPYLHTGEAIPADVVIEDIRSMPTLTPPNEWVSVEDRLPEVFTPVLVCREDGKVEQGCRDALGIWITFETRTECVTHWMPEPDISRLTTKREYRKDRLQCLGNAVVPQQFYPVFQAMQIQLLSI